MNLYHLELNKSIARCKENLSKTTDPIRISIIKRQMAEYRKARTIKLPAHQENSVFIDPDIIQ